MSRRRSLLIGMTAWVIVLFCFVVLYERHDRNRSKSVLHEHVTVISHALWNLDPSGASEYLSLAAQLENDQTITITDEAGEVFLHVTGPPPSRIDLFFMSVGLLPLQIMSEPIMRQGVVIGELVAEHRHDTVYMHLNALVVSGLLFLASWLFSRILAAKQNLAAEVAERTNELVTSNVNLQQEKGFSDDIIEGLPGIFCMIGPGKAISRWNNRILSETGYTADEFAGMQPEEFFKSDDRQTMNGIIKTATEQERSQFNANLITRSGTLIPYYLTVMKIEQNGNPHLIFLGIDATERKLAERTAANLREQLHQAQKMEAIGQLAGGVAHDFNNLLVAITGNAELLIDELASDPASESMAQDIVTAATRAAELTQQLLGFSRKGKLQTTNVDMHLIIAEVIALLERSVDKRIEILRKLKASQAVVSGDLTQLQSALLNLAVNGRDAMPDGGRLTLSTRNILLDESYSDDHVSDLSPGAYLEIDVADTGIGMDEELQKRAFEPFFTTKKQGEGTGLGLASVYGCVKAHQGAVTVYSEHGRGTTFKMLLPTVTDADPLETQAKIPVTVPVKGQGRILVVDDEDTVRRFAENVLIHLGYSVSSCSDGSEAVDFFQREGRQIDLVLLDLNMPKMSGKETFYLLKKIDSEIRILLTSGFTGGGVTDELLANGALGFLKKPYSIDEVARQVAHNLQNHG